MLCLTVLFSRILVELSGKTETDTHVQRRRFDRFSNDSQQILYAGENTTAGTLIFDARNTSFSFVVRFITRHYTSAYVLHIRASIASRDTTN